MLLRISAAIETPCFFDMAFNNWACFSVSWICVRITARPSL